ncbi:virulence factor [Photorhabdus akhurstii]|uniref:virulence factor n=1 Tax=Photorhabdus akhurstii TaxID=171438 RepID=UPI0022B27662|nr:virulence factor [Photorhabdus akhurstii]
MYAIAFDLVVVDTEQHHPKGVSQAYAEIGATLAQYGFRRVQGSLYISDDENMLSFLWRSNPSRRNLGFLRQSVIFVRSVLNSGLILRP